MGKFKRALKKLKADFENSENLVEPMGFEPTTSSMPSRRAPSCATAPHQPGILRNKNRKSPATF
jgi:hypothetical protein